MVIKGLKQLSRDLISDVGANNMRQEGKEENKRGGMDGKSLNAMRKCEGGGGAREG